MPDDDIMYCTCRIINHSSVALDLLFYSHIAAAIGILLTPRQPPNNPHSISQHFNSNFPMIQPDLHCPDVQQTLGQRRKRRVSCCRQDGNYDP